MHSAQSSDYIPVALEFARALGSRAYSQAYALTSSEYQTAHTVEQLQAAFESIVPTDWQTVGPIEAGHTMESWPGKQASDVAWAYISIGGDVYSEAVILVVTREGDALRIRSVEFGRP